MLIGEATLKTANFSHRLMLLLDDLRDAGCTVWLEGMNVRFDLPDAPFAASELAQAEALDNLLSRYRDVVSWVPLRDVLRDEGAGLDLNVDPAPTSGPSLGPALAAPPPRRNGFFSFKRSHPTYKDQR